MVRYCVVFGCFNNATDTKLSFHQFPKDKKLCQVWISRIRRNPIKDFKLNKHCKVCSEHFAESDFIYADSNRRRLKEGACPSIFSWTKAVTERTLPAKRKRLAEERAALDAEETDTATEGEGTFDESTISGCISRGVQASVATVCVHRFSYQGLLLLCRTNEKERKYFKHMTGFESSSRFLTVLRFILPDLDRKSIVYWYKTGKNRRINTSLLFNQDIEYEVCEQEPDEEVYTREDHLLSIEDEFLLVLMKLRLGLTNIDLSIRFGISEGSVSNIIITWINFLYVQLGKLKIWPNRDIIIENMPQKMKEEYPSTIIIVDCTELRIQCPSSLLLQSQSFSNYKSTNTLKSLVGVDAKGGFMFISQLYTGSVSDKEIVTRSGFIDILSRKLETGEILKGDAIMADKGFNIHNELHSLGLKLNIPPFLGEKLKLNESDVIKTQTIAKHRIHVERAIGKVRNFLIFNSKLPVSLLGTINQLWTVCCLLTNFMDPVLADD